MCRWLWCVFVCECVCACMCVREFESKCVWVCVCERVYMCVKESVCQGLKGASSKIEMKISNIFYLFVKPRKGYFEWHFHSKLFFLLWKKVWILNFFVGLKNWKRWLNFIQIYYLEIKSDQIFWLMIWEWDWNFCLK